MISRRKCYVNYLIIKKISNYEHPFYKSEVIKSNVSSILVTQKLIVFIIIYEFIIKCDTKLFFIVFALCFKIVLIYAVLALAQSILCSHNHLPTVIITNEI